VECGVESWKHTLAELASGRGAALKRHAFLLCGDDFQAEDLVQEALVRAFARPLRAPRPGAAEAAGGAGRIKPMSIDEQELRRRLEEAAAQASPPRFTAEGLACRIRRNRAQIVAAALGAFVAAAAIAVAIPVMLSGASRPVNGEPEVIPVQLSFTVTVNGQSRVFPGRGVPTAGTAPRLVITPGEDLILNVDVTVPAHATVEALWLGIANGTYGGGPDGPTGVNPILAARTGKSLGPGLHRFRLHWVPPTGLRPGTDRQLVAEWAVKDGEVTTAIAELAVQP
jgi:hypothetical protein